MIQLNNSLYNFDTTINECIAGITGNAALRNRVSDSKKSLLPEEARYLALANTNRLHTINSISHPPPDPIIAHTVTKSDLIKVYDQYFVPEEKPARRIYDALLNSAKESCPFCGGIGTPKNLDHFLPKTHFPQFSVLPHNLVPSCRDCNMDGKAQAFAVNAEDQIIHPYADKIIFFTDQWIFANYDSTINNDPGEFEYLVIAPGTWDDVDKQRALKHFTDFDLASRYSKKAAENLGTVLSQIQSLQSIGLDNPTIIATILQPGITKAPFINHWQKGMYQALTNMLL